MWVRWGGVCSGGVIVLSYQKKNINKLLLLKIRFPVAFVVVFWGDVLLVLLVISYKYFYQSVGTRRGNVS